MKPVLPPPRQAGFTLVEAIVAMVITAILAGTMVMFIRRPVQNYVDAAGRAELANIAELSLRRIAREVRTALPNSVRVMMVGGDYLLELIPTKAGGTYLTPDDPASTPTTPFTVVGTMPAAPYNIVAGDYVVVYNLGSQIDRADAYVGGNRAQVRDFTGTNIVNFQAANPFVAPYFAGRSSTFFVTGQPVTFRCNASAAGLGTLTRYWNYGFLDPQPDPAALANVSSALLASNVVGCRFDYVNLANVRNGLLGLTIVLAQPASGGTEQVTLTYQIHVGNAP